MRNPGLKNHTPDEPFLRVISRTTANQVMRQPQTYNGDGSGQVVPPEPATLRENVLQGPPSASSNTPGPNATNGAPPILRLNDISATPPAPDPNRGAEQRKRELQKGVGGGSKENPAYDDAQKRIQRRMQDRRAHPLHQARKAEEWPDSYDLMAHEHELGPDPLADSVLNPEGQVHSPWHTPDVYVPPIRHIDPRSPQYDADYNKGWEASDSYGNGDWDDPDSSALDRMDNSNASHAAYDGYMDRAVGREKYHYRAVRRLGLDNPEELPDEHWDNPERVASVKTAAIPPHPDLYPSQKEMGDEDLLSYRDAEYNPSGTQTGSLQPMFQIKNDLTKLHSNPYRHDGACETCYLKKGRRVGREDHDVVYLPGEDEPDHEFTPFQVNPGQRFSAQVPHEDPVYPYSGRVDPEDTTDLENLQSGDDTYATSPHQAPNLMDRVFGPSTGEETPEHERAADAHERFFRDLIPGMPAAHREMKAEDLPSDLVDRTDAEDVAGGFNTMMNKVLGDENIAPPGGGLTQSQKDHVTNYVQGLQENHKQKVKRLQDEWRARGGRKTGEPMPVARFDPRLTHKGGQQIVPMEGNPFPELEHPIYYVGNCEGCGRTLFDGADVSGDPRGALGDHTRGRINAAEYEVSDQSGRPEGDDRRLHGPSALICPSCEDDREKHNRIVDKYLGHKAGDQTGGYHWTWQRQPDGTKKNVLVNHTYKDDREGIWHAPGEQVGNCPQCDAGETGFYHTSAWSNILREGIGVDND